MINSVALEERANGLCELCKASAELSEFAVPPKKGASIDELIAICESCDAQISQKQEIDTNHLRCLTESIWSEVDGIKVVSYRLLKRLKGENWAEDLLGMMYLDEELQEWANAAAATYVVHKDANGHILQAGDSVSLIQDLNVKGAGFTAKRGTSVKRIRLVQDDPNLIEGKVEGQQIFILTKFVKKSN